MIVLKYSNSFQIDSFVFYFMPYALLIQSYFYFRVPFLFYLTNKKTSNSNLQLKKQFVTLNQETIDWSLNLNQKQFGQYSILGELNDQKFRFIQNHYDPYFETYNTTYYQKINFHEFFGYVDQKLSNLMLPQTYCLQLYISKLKTQKIIKKLPSCNKQSGIPITPWYWKGEQLYILTDICLKLSMKKDKLYFQGGCFQDGFIYKELINDEYTSFENLSLQLRHVDDPYIQGITISGESVKPIKHSLQLSLIYYSFLFGISGTIYMILIYFILSLRKRSEIQYV